MAKYRKTWLKFVNYILVGVLILLGFPSCTTDDPAASLEHRQPHAHFEINGKVLNSQEEPVSDIQIIVKGITGTVYSEYVNNLDTLYSNYNGEFSFNDSFAWPDTKYRIIHKDINPDGNIRTYKTDSVNVDMPKLTGSSGNWDKGNASTEITIKLQENPDRE